MGEQGRTTFILGAGASHHAGYPFVKEVGEKLLRWMRLPRACSHFDFAESANFIEERFGNDIEKIFNGLQPGLNERLESLLANVHKPCIIEAMRQWFVEIHQQHTARSYEQFASEIVKSGDCVITFNYDVSLRVEVASE